MIGEITKIVLNVLRSPKMISLAKNIGSIQVMETETHIMFFLSKIRSEDSQIILDLKQLIPEAVILTTRDGKPFLSIFVEPKMVEYVEREASTLGGEQQ